MVVDPDLAFPGWWESDDPDHFDINYSDLRNFILNFSLICAFIYIGTSTALENSSCSQNRKIIFSLPTRSNPRTDPDPDRE